MKIQTTLILSVILCACGVSPANQARLTTLLNPQATSTATPTPSPTPSVTPAPSPITIIPDGTIGKGYYYTACTDFTTITASNPAPGSGGTGETEFSGADYANLASIDSSYVVHECQTSPGQESQIVEFSYTVTPVSAAQYSTLTVNWTGILGQKSGLCGGTPTSNFAPFDLIEAFHGSTWDGILQTPTITLTTISQTFSNPTNFLFGGKIWVRLHGRANLSSCSTIRSDFTSLTLTP